MADETIEIIYDSARKRRVVIFRRLSGAYGYREERRYKTETTDSWAPLWGRACHYADLPTAKREVVGDVEWLREQM